MNKKNIGILLITIGLFIIFNTLNLIGTDIFLYLISVGFFAAYFVLGARKHYRNIGFLIPAAVLMAVALFPDLQSFNLINQLGGAVFFILLGLAFLIVFIHTAAFKSWDWPIYPTVIFISFGILTIIIDNISLFQEFKYLYYVLAGFLIASGSFLLYLHQKKSRNAKLK